MRGIQAHTSVFGRRSSDTRLVCPGSFEVRDLSCHGCYGVGEKPSPSRDILPRQATSILLNRYKRWQTIGGSHGNNTDSDGASLAGALPYEGDKQEFPWCVAGFLRVRDKNKSLPPPESEGRIPPRYPEVEVNRQLDVKQATRLPVCVILYIWDLYR